MFRACPASAAYRWKENGSRGSGILPVRGRIRDLSCSHLSLRVERLPKTLKKSLKANRNYSALSSSRLYCKRGWSSWLAWNQREISLKCCFRGCSRVKHHVEEIEEGMNVGLWHTSKSTCRITEFTSLDYHRLCIKNMHVSLDVLSVVRNLGAHENMARPVWNVKAWYKLLKGERGDAVEAFKEEDVLISGYLHTQKGTAFKVRPKVIDYEMDVMASGLYNCNLQVKILERRFAAGCALLFGQDWLLGLDLLKRVNKNALQDVESGNPCFTNVIPTILLL